jgi:hypothetical protein
MSRFWGGRQIWCGWASKLVVGGGVKSQKEASTATDWQIYHAGFGQMKASNRRNRVFEMHN